MTSAPPPGPGWKLLTPGSRLVKTDEFWSFSLRRWKRTEDAGQLAKPSLTYRRKTDAKAASTKVDLGEKLASRAHERAKALQMSTPAYVRQCVEGELARCNVAKIQAQAPTATPPIAHWQNGESD